MFDPAMLDPAMLIPSPMPSSPISVRAPGMTLVFAHDLGSRACDILLDRVAAGAGHELARRGSASGSRALARSSAVHVEEVGSLEAGWVALDRAAKLGPSNALVLVCLDLPPAPRAGATLATWAVSLGLPVVAVTHSRRWLPLGDNVFRTLPVLSPTAPADEVGAALGKAFASSLEQIGQIEDEDTFPSRPSWLG